MVELHALPLLDLYNIICSTNRVDSSLLVSKFTRTVRVDSQVSPQSRLQTKIKGPLVPGPLYSKSKMIALFCFHCLCCSPFSWSFLVTLQLLDRSSTPSRSGLKVHSAERCAIHSEQEQYKGSLPGKGGLCNTQQISH